ncbi:M23 family metallopeptidase [uncultured Sphingomonas sp.]|uniref:M23 family metallopeptidase n=1 Tax=uncultured Sphingomonas sp. TaxID=158754 RepID=UPI0035CB8441
MRRIAAMALGIAIVIAAPAAGQSAAPAAGQSDAFHWTGTTTQGGLIGGTAPAGTVTLTLDGKPVMLAPDRRFIAGFDRDAKSAAMLVATLADGRFVTQALTIEPRGWALSRLDSLPKTPVPDAEFAVVRPPELAAIAAARARPTDATGWRQKFTWPTTGRISTFFGSQRIYKNGEAGAYHSGIDIARATGTVVTAPADGVVTLVADHPFTLEGNLLMIDHGMGLNSAFLHLSRIDVHVGDHVRQGQPIGLVGMTGRATGPHLHWGLKWRDAKLDPLLVAGAMPGAK